MDIFVCGTFSPFSEKIVTETKTLPVAGERSLR
jgi:hypothetical protein